jgi:hypothetical protein
LQDDQAVLQTGHLNLSNHLMERVYEKNQAYFKKTFSNRTGSNLALIFHQKHWVTAKVIYLKSESCLNDRCCYYKRSNLNALNPHPLSAGCINSTKLSLTSL